MSAQPSVPDQQVTDEESPRPLRRLLGPYVVLRGNRPLTLLFVGGSLSACIDWLYVVALCVLAYRLTHAASMVALLTVTRLLPYALLVPVSGLLSDRLDRRALLVGAAAGRALCFLGLIAVQSAALLPVAVLLVLVATLLSSLFRPALLASLPTLAEERELLQANSLFSQVEMLALGAGPAVAGLLLALGGERATFLVAGIGMLAAAVSLAAVALPAHQESVASEGAGWAAEVLAGFRVLVGQDERVLLGLGLTLAGLALEGGAWWTITTVLAERTFRFGGLGLGVLNAAYAIGGFVTGLVVGDVALKRSITHLFIAGAGLSSLALAGLGLSPAGVLPFACVAVIGLADVVTKVIATTAIQTATRPASLGRVFGALESGLMAATVLGSLIVSPLIAAVGVRAADVLVSGAGLLLLVIALPLLLGLDRVLGVRLFLRQVPILSAVPGLLLDDLAASVRLDCLPGRHTLIQEGEPGDRLYLIKRGRLEVVASAPEGGEVHLATLAARDYVGETALLRAVPRTATVRSLGPAEVYSLSRAAVQDLLRRSEELERAMRAGSDARDRERCSRLAARSVGTRSGAPRSPRRAGAGAIPPHRHPDWNTEHAP
jgi:MFS family permease